MKNTTINLIKVALEKEMESQCIHRTEKPEYIKQLFETYKEFISIYGDWMDGMILEHYKERLGIKDD